MRWRILLVLNRQKRLYIYVFQKFILIREGNLYIIQFKRSTEFLKVLFVLPEMKSD